MRKLSNKKLAAAACVAVAVTGTGVAYAYWTTTGSGTGSAAVGTDADNLTITAATQPTPDDLDTEEVDEASPNALVPGGAVAPLQLFVSNPNPSTASLKGLSLAITNVKCGTAEVNNDWFSIVDTTVTNAALIPTNSSPQNIKDSGVTIRMNNSSENQNPCKDVAATFDLTVSGSDLPVS